MLTGIEKKTTSADKTKQLRPLTASRRATLCVVFYRHTFTHMTKSPHKNNLDTALHNSRKAANFVCVQREKWEQR